jgi:hypothetical protein
VGLSDGVINAVQRLEKVQKEGRYVRKFDTSQISFTNLSPTPATTIPKMQR